MFFIVVENKESADKLRLIYNRYGKFMYSAAYAVTGDKHYAEDAVHNALIKISNKLGNVDPDNKARAKAFLYIVCRNAAIDIVKNRTYLNDDENDVENISNEDAGIVTNPSDIISTRETSKKLKQALDALDAKYRDVFLLKYAYNYSREDIADMLGIRVETVKKRIARAKKMLADYLIKEGIMQ